MLKTRMERIALAALLAAVLLAPASAQEDDEDKAGAEEEAAAAETTEAESAVAEEEAPAEAEAEVEAPAAVKAEAAAETPATAAEPVDLMSQSTEAVEAKNKNCVACHTETDSASMHESDVPIACVDCHGGNAQATAQEEAHVLPANKRLFKSSRNPERSAALFLKESADFARFINPSDLRVADQSCGQSSCHEDQVAKVRKSMMTHGSSLWGAALYNNGAIPMKDPHYGESYSRDGKPQRIRASEPVTAEDTRKTGELPYLDPLPRWEITQLSNVLRIFERGGRKPLEIGLPELFEPPGRPERRSSQRGHGTNNRTDPVFFGIQKTRLFDPTLTMLGTNDQPGDYRSSGCAACHVVYANDRDPVHSGPWAKYGNRGQSATVDPTISSKEEGHPIQHKFTTAIPSSQCVVCHMHPGTNVLFEYYGTTWWDNETDGELMYPKEPLNLSPSEQIYRVETTNPEGSAIRGKWNDPEFLRNLSDLNPKLQRTQFADYHGHGWVYRKIYKQDRYGNLLDARGKKVDWEDPDRFKKAVHLRDIHLEKGMHCVDCHFEQDNHGNGKLYGEVRNALEIQCIDCHGSIAWKADPTDKDRGQKTTGPAGGNKLSKYNRTAFGPRFFMDGGKLMQRSAVTKDLVWEVVQTRDTVDSDSSFYSEGSRLAKTMRRDAKTWGSVPEKSSELAHGDDNVTCIACHSSWMTSCFGCHLAQQTNRRTPMLHNEGVTLRNWTSYNFQVVRDDVFMLAKDGSVIGGRVAPARSSSAVVVSSQNANREWFYTQQQTISAEGYSGQAFNTHVPHTVRATETKVCTDCHVSEKGDNNAQMAQLLTLGTQMTNFMGQSIFVGMESHGLEAVTVTEWSEPQAVIGSHLHKLAYPEEYKAHLARDLELAEAFEHPGNDILDLNWMFGNGDEVLSLQLRGEFLYAANGPGGLRVYDVAFVGDKGFSERIVTAPVSPLGQRLYVDTEYATWVAAPSTLALDPVRARRPENEEQPIHPLFGYLYVTDIEEGLILVGAATLLDGDPANNFLERALTFNPGNKLAGAVHVRIIGTYAYVLCNAGLVVVDIDDPTRPEITAEVPLSGPRSIDHQFRYAFVVDRDGLKVLDITNLDKPKLVDGATVKLPDARDVYVARTYAYIAGGRQGLVIVDVEKPESPKVSQVFDANGALNDSRSVRVGMTNQSIFAYLADGKNGLRVIELASPERTPGIFGFSPKPDPKVIATYPTAGPAVALSKGLDRDRAVDESGNQLVVFGRRGGRPFNKEELRRMYLRNGKLWTVTDFPPEGGKELAFAAPRTDRVIPPRGGTPADVEQRRPGVRLREKPGVRLREEGEGVRLKPGVRMKDAE